MLEHILPDDRRLVDDPTYQSWFGMIGRCYDPEGKTYTPSISVCYEWLVSYQSFLDHLGCRPENHALHRRKYWGDYTLDNTCWIECSPELNCWRGMILRCSTGRSGHYRYGERGIAVCDRWLNSFDDFLSDMGVRPSNKYALDRIDVDQGYCAVNCRWLLISDNTRRIRNEEHLGIYNYGRVYEKRYKVVTPIKVYKNGKNNLGLGLNKVSNNKLKELAETKQTE